MPRPKSLIPQLRVDHARRAHNCQHNSRHRLQAGDVRLKVKANRAYEHFCAQCALEIIDRDIETLRALARVLRAEHGSQ